MKQSFADQFEPEGDGFLYRNYTKSAPIRVSRAERDRYIQSFDRFTKYSFWALMAATVLLIFSFAGYSAETGRDLPEIDIGIGVGLILAFFMGAFFWVRNQPMRELRGRGTVGEARSKAEMKRLFFAKMTYGQIAAISGGALIALVRIDFHRDLFSGWNLAWMVLAVFTVLASIITAFRKWLFESRQK